LEEKIKKLRSALVGLVGFSNREDLEAMKDVMNVMAVPSEDKQKMLNAINVLIEIPESE